VTPRNTLIFGKDEQVAAWVARQIPHVGAQGFGPCRAIAVAHDGRPLAAIVYHDYQPEAGVCQISMASTSPLWAKPDTIRALLAVPFDQYRCFKVWTCIPADNERAIRFNVGIGMVREAVLRHQFGKKRHACIYGMTADEYAAKWRLKEAA
jgi:RimJ/RimL family protein N-acetyltransferase